jgi:hypothetical protein
VGACTWAWITAMLVSRGHVVEAMKHARQGFFTHNIRSAFSLLVSITMPASAHYPNTQYATNL